MIQIHSIPQRVSGFGAMIKGPVGEFNDATTDEYAKDQKALNVGKMTDYILPRIHELGAETVLDVGCGVGTMVNTLLEKGLDAYGVDLVTLERHWVAQNLDRERFFFVEPYHLDLPFEDNTLDFVFTLGAIEHVGTTNGHSDRRSDYHVIRQAWLRELFRVVKPGGHLLIGGPNRCFPIDLAHGSDSKASSLELTLSKMIGRTVHKPWGENFLWGFKDVKRYLGGLPYTVKAQRLSGYIYYSRVPKVFRGMAQYYIDYMPEVLLGTGLNPWMMALIGKKMKCIDPMFALLRSPARKLRRFFLPVMTSFLTIWFSLLLVSCKEERKVLFDSHITKQGSFEAQVSLDLKKQTPVNPLLLGSNVQWVDSGDGLISSGSLKFVPELVDKAKQLGVSVLRYPGGSLSDLYHWRDGLGPKEKRGTNKRFHSQGEDQVLFGTQEFLTLSKALDAEPMITVNIITGTAEEAAAWVKKVNVTGFDGLPKVRFWEIGNEPYLVDDNQKALAIKPAEFARRVDEFIRAMKNVDPTIKVGVPLRSDKLAGIPATPLPGYNKAVLTGVSEPVDFVSVHNAYYPFAYDQAPEPSELYLAVMAASRVVEENIKQTQNELSQYQNKHDIPIALTEYNAMFTLGRGNSDGYIASFAGALYIADLLMMLAKQDNLLMANHWSLSGNWYFGAISQDGGVRPSYHVLKGFKRIWRGSRIGTEVQCPTFNAPAVGFLPARENIPFVSALATVDQGQTALMLINKHPTAEAILKISGVDQSALRSVQLRTLKTEDLFAYDSPAARISWQVSETINVHKANSLKLPPLSLSIVQFNKD